MLAMSIMAMAGMSGLHYQKPNQSSGFSDDEMPTAKQREENDKKNIEKQARNRGLKAYSYRGETIWALNPKNAHRKAKNRGLI